MRRVALAAILALLLAAFAVLVYVRAASHDIARWHVDPVAAVLPPSPNAHRIGPETPEAVFSLAPEQLAAIVSRTLAAEPRTRRLASSNDGLHTTWVQRSLLLGFPDYVSVRVVPRGEEGAALAIFSRSRYGYSDLGVNRARAEAWLSAIRAAAEGG